MDFESLLYAAKKNEHTQKRESQNVKCYQTKYAPPKKEEKKCLSANIQKFLARKEEEERLKQVDAQKKREDLLELRSHDTKAKKRVQAMLKRTKAANKSVIEDAVDNDNTAVTLLGGKSQPDEDDYGYVSQEASAYYNKLMDKYSTLPPEEPKFKSNMKHSVKDLNSTKDRVRMALLKEEEEEMMPHKRKRKPKEEKTDEVDEAEEQETLEEENKPEKIVKPKRPIPPPMDFESLLKLAEKKQFEPVKIEPKVRDPEDDERPMTKKQRMEYEREREWRMKKERAQAERTSQSRSATDEGRPQQKSDRPDRSQQDGAPRAGGLFQRIPKLSSRDKEQRQEDEQERRGSVEHRNNGKTLSQSKNFNNNGSINRSNVKNINQDERNVRQSKDDNVEKSRNIRDSVNGKKVLNSYREDSMTDDECSGKKREGRIEKVNRDDKSRAYREGSSGSDETRNKRKEGRIEKVNRNDKSRAYREGSSGSDETRNKRKEGRIEKVNRNEGKYRNVGGNIQTEPCEIEVSGRNVKKDERRVGEQESRTAMKERKLDLKERKGEFQERKVGAYEKREPQERREESQAEERRATQDQIDAQEWREYQEWKEARAKERREAQDRREAQERRETQDRREAQDRRETQDRREAQERKEAQDRRVVQERRDVQEKSNSLERKNEHWRSEKSTKSKFADENTRKRPMEGSVKSREIERSSSNTLENSRLIRTETGVKVGKSDGREQKEERTCDSVGKQSSKDTSASSDSDKKKVSSVGSGNTLSGYSRKVQDAILAKYKERIEQSAANKVGLMQGKSSNVPVRPVVKSEGSTARTPTMNKTDQSRAPLSKSIPKKDLLMKPQDRQQPRPTAANAGNTRPTGMQQKSSSNGPSFSRQESSTSRDGSSQKLLKSPAVRDQDSNMKSRPPIQNPRDPKEGNIRQPLKADAQPRPNQSSDVRSRQFPPADVRSRQFPPSDVRNRKFPPGDVRRKPMKPPAKRRIIDSDEEEYDSELDDFIVDDGPEEDYSSLIKQITGYDRSKYADMDDDECMESSFAQQLKEEFISTKTGILEDLEDIQKEQDEKKMKKMKMMKKKRLK